MAALVLPAGTTPAGVVAPDLAVGRGPSSGAGGPRGRGAGADRPVELRGRFRGLLLGHELNPEHVRDHVRLDGLLEIVEHREGLDLVLNQRRALRAGVEAP